MTKTVTCPVCGTHFDVQLSKSAEPTVYTTNEHLARQTGCTHKTCDETGEVKDLRSMHIDSTDIALKAMHYHALEEAARLLVRAELLHREIVRRGGTE